MIFLILQKRHWPSLISTFSSSLQGPFLVTSPVDLANLFQASRYRQFLHIAFVHDVNKDWGTLVNSEPQTLWLPIKHSLNFSQCHKYH